MVNRILIRIKVVQIVYSYLLKDDKEMDKAEKELFFSLGKSYELYYFLLLLMIELTDTQSSRIENAKTKHLATNAEKNPNTRLVNNRFIAQLRDNKDMQDYLSRQKISWVNEPEFIRSLANRILASDIYADYIASEENSFDVDREFWRKVFKNIISEDEDLCEQLESQSLYWNDDLYIISTFVLKTIKRFEENQSIDQKLIPMFKDEEDAEFAKQLFRRSILEAEKNRQKIDKHTKNWELDRIAFMDVVVMIVALAEIETFPSIPLKVSLNEYIEIAKAYSTVKSGYFINGILDSVICELKKEGLLTKE